MCLMIKESRHHKNIFGKYKPHKLKEDLRVYKILLNRANGLVTPYQYMQVEINKPFLKFSRREFMRDISYKIMKHGFGYHAYTSLYQAICDKTCEKVYRALIPKGSYVYFGTCGEICANTMIICGEL